MNFNRRGQLSIINIVFFLILVVIGAVVAPIIDSVLEEYVTNNNVTGTKALLANNITVIFWIGIIITFFLYVTPIRPQQY